MSTRWETVCAISLLSLSLPVCAWLAMRQVDLHSQIDNARARLEQERNAAAVTTLNSIALPANAPLSLCNQTRDHAQVTALAGIYSVPNGDFNIFNSARDQWRTWDVPAGARVPLDLRESGWNGQALFYAIDVNAGGKRQLLTGTSRDLHGGCVNLFAFNPAVHQPH
ncbi:MAG TPA: hypothetical protein VKB38_10255 [Terracidiphilus sp.]|nr:hypothetical protein [Terracidiphilus sp.]